MINVFRSFTSVNVAIPHCKDTTTFKIILFIYLFENKKGELTVSELILMLAVIVPLNVVLLYYWINTKYLNIAFKYTTGVNVLFKHCFCEFIILL